MPTPKCWWDQELFKLKSKEIKWHAQQNLQKKKKKQKKQCPSSSPGLKLQIYCYILKISYFFTLIHSINKYLQSDYNTSYNCSKSQGINSKWYNSYWESQFQGRLIRSPGFLRRKGSGALEEEKEVWGSQGEKDKRSFLHCFVLVNVTMHLAWGHVSP